MAGSWLSRLVACVLFRAVLSFAGPVFPGPVVPWGGPRFGPCGPCVGPLRFPSLGRSLDDGDEGDEGREGHEGDEAYEGHDAEETSRSALRTFVARARKRYEDMFMVGLVVSVLRCWSCLN